MTSPLMDQAAGHQPSTRELTPPRPAHGWLNRTVLYVPRFARHLRRRLRSGMSLGRAWRSARLRMHDYR